jgi:hypothetical protein
LGWAYFLEFAGINDFLGLWMACAMFFAVNVALIVAVIRSTRSVPYLIADGDGVRLSTLPYLTPSLSAAASKKLD